jgi:predicted nucleotidyltransferase component of viral defense system
MEKYISEEVESIIIKPAISRSPVLSVNKTPVPALEKILVDIFCDTVLSYVFGGSEMVHIYKQAFDKYSVNISMAELCRAKAEKGVFNGLHAGKFKPLPGGPDQMILPETFTKEWIQRFKKQKEFSKINPPVLEKMIHALALSEALKKAGMSFTFKGGSSLILLLEKARRFSVDIDILTTQTREEMEKLFADVIENSSFSDYVLDEARSYNKGVPKAHYGFSYPSEYNKQANHIFLDILFEESLYPELVEVPIAATWLKTGSESVLVKVPSVESITGDKLTAFAPNTTGILYNKGKELEIIKQLFDLGNLFDLIQCFDTVSRSFSRFVVKEINYRGLNIGREEVLDDIIDTGMLLAQREKTKTEPGNSHFKELQNGILQFKNFLISGAFRIDEAIEAAAKAAYMAAKLKAGDNGPPAHFDRRKNISDYLIENPVYSHLNKLRKLPNGALFYWYHAIKLMG